MTEVRPVTVIGSVNMDLVMRVSRCPLPGETTKSLSMNYCPGGKGANQAVAACRFGGDVSFVGCLGNDAFGDELQQVLSDEKLNLVRLQRSSTDPTGVATVLVDDSGENCIVVSLGANGQLRVRDIEELAQAGQMAGGILLCQLETPLEVVVYAIELAEQQGTTVVLNPSPVAPLGRELLQRVDYLVVNSGEASFLSGVNIYDELSARKSLEILREQGARTILLTLGKDGVLVYHQSDLYPVAAPLVTAVDTTGAGDTFAGVFAAALAEGTSVKEAVTSACIAAAIAVQTEGALPSIPDRIAIENFNSRGRK